MPTPPPENTSCPKTGPQTNSETDPAKDAAPRGMHIWVDADAAPNAIKDVVFRAAERLQINTILVANQYVRTPPSKVITAIQVPQGFDVADDTIVQKLVAGDLVITADIPLADEVITKGGAALNPRGMLYTKENIKDRLSRRDMMEELRSAGPLMEGGGGGPKPLDKRDVQTFANALDRYLARNAQAAVTRPKPIQ